MITTKYVMDGEGNFAIVSKMTGIEHVELARNALGLDLEAMKACSGSAGFLMLRDGSLVSYGSSVSLDLDSRPEDGEKITAALCRGLIRLEPIMGREEDVIASNHEAFQAPDLEVATLDGLLAHRLID